MASKSSEIQMKEKKGGLIESFEKRNGKGGGDILMVSWMIGRIERVQM